jgi:hypothetical protein
MPVMDMLAHSPPLPLTIFCGRKVTAEDESGILLALSHRDRIRHIDLRNFRNVKKFFTVMGDQFPILERMYIYSHPRVPVVLPETFQAPNLRHLELSATSLPIGSPLLTTAAGLVTLVLHNIPAPPYSSPSYLLTRLSLMLQLEELSIGFQSLIQVPNLDVEWQSCQTPDMTTLPNLRQFIFQGPATYLESLVSRISVPSLSDLHVDLDHLTFTMPCFLQFMQTSKNFTFTAVQVKFGRFDVSIYAEPRKDTFLLTNSCLHLDSQVVSATQFFGSLSPILSVFFFFF